MDYKRKALEIDLKYDIGLTHSELKKVVANFESKNFQYSLDSQWASAMEGMVMSFRSNPLAAAAHNSKITANMKCPVCDRVGKPVTLLKGRKAYLCKIHNAVNPALIEEEL